MPSDFEAGGKKTAGSTIASGDATTTHQFTASVLIQGNLSASAEVSASAFWTPAGELTPGGGSGGGIAFDGSTANGVATRKNATTASIESNFTFDGATNILSVTGAFNHTGSHHLSGTLTITGVEATPMLVMDDSDASAQIGRAHIGYVGSSDFAAFAHQDQATTTAYAISARSTGQTDINAAGSTPITFRISSATKMQLDSNGNLAVGNNYAPGTYKFDVSGSANLGKDASHMLHITGAIDQSGSTSTFYIPPGQSGAFAVVGESNEGQGDPVDGRYFQVDTSIKTIRMGAGAVIEHNKKLWLGTGSLISNPETGVGSAYISYSEGEARLILSGSDSGIKLSGSIIASEIDSGSIAGPGSYVGVDTNGQLVLTASSGGGGGTPDGSDTQIQFNDAGSFGAEANYTFVKGPPSTVVLTGTYIHSGTLNLTTFTNDLGTVVSLDPDQGIYDINAGFGEASRFAVSGTITATGSRAVGQYPNWEGPSGDALLVGGGATGAEAGGNQPVLICKVTGSNYGGNDLGHVGIGTNNPKVQLDIRWNAELATDEAGGDVVTFGADPHGLTAGSLYYLNSNGQWASASAHGTGSGNNQLLAIALSTTASSGMLIRGWANTSKYSGDFLQGQAVYISSASSAANEGQMSGAAPTAADSYVRIVGYAGTNPNTVYFNPGTNWVELS